MAALKVHVFVNGSAIFEFPPTTPSKALESFRLAYNQSPEEALMISGFEIEVIEHGNPLTTLRRPAAIKPHGSLQTGR
jgi:hypothetical protein